MNKDFSSTSEYAEFMNYRTSGDKALRDALVEKYLYIAQILSKRFVNRGIDYEDIYQVAALGILYAVERFDPERGVRFATFATPTVLGEIRKYFRDKGNFIRVPRTLYEMFYKAERIRRGASDEPAKELSRALHIPEEDIERVYKYRDYAFIESLEYEAYADGNLTLADILGKEDNQFIMIENKDFIKSSMNRLGEKERELVKKRYYDGLTQSEIAAQWQVSQMYVSRMERTVLKKLRDFYFHD